MRAAGRPVLRTARPGRTSASVHADSRCQADPRDARGFSLMEVLIVLAIVAILATLAVPGLQNGIVRDQIVTAAPLADVAKKPVALLWAATQTLPADNAAAGLPVPEKIVNNHVRSVAVQDGAIHVTFGNSAHALIAGKVLTFRPAVVEDAPIVPVAWVCGLAAPPANMAVKGEDRTDIPQGLLPFNCHPAAK
jgi:type IV pilus assembly protein PilA